MPPGNGLPTIPSGQTHVGPVFDIMHWAPEAHEYESHPKITLNLIKNIIKYISTKIKNYVTKRFSLPEIHFPLSGLV